MSEIRRSAAPLVVLLVLAVMVDRGSQLTMISRGQTLVLSERQKARLDCRFEALRFNLFDYPVLWRKVQVGEETQVNIMGNINEPFMSTNRYEAFFNDTPTVYNLFLTISNLRIEDSGNYTCEVRGPHSVIQGIVTHSLFVKDGVKRVVITDEEVACEGRSLAASAASRSAHAGSDASSSSSSSSSHVLRFTENRQATLRCIACGGYPPPTLHLYFGQRDVTDHFTPVSEVRLIGEPGLRQIEVRSERRTFAYRPSSDEDGVKVTCIATVADDQPFNSFVHVAVEYSPKLSCTGAEAYLNDQRVVLRCEIRSKPRLIRTHWVVDPDGTTLSDSSLANRTKDFYVDISHRDDGGVDTRLIVRSVRKELFRNYTIIAQNPISTSTKEVILSQKYNPYHAPHDARRREDHIGERHSTSSVARSSSSSSRMYEWHFTIFTCIRFKCSTSFAPVLTCFLVITSGITIEAFRRT